MVELELKDCSAGVPEGLKIAPAHFLSAPTNEEFRKFIEGDNHQHFLLYFAKHANNQYSDYFCCKSLSKIFKS